ncbi:MAG: hypothetical protein HC912_07610 [Saprospiraceae bacterium]|nr:hypothetical protein [Saprospiraceae bacterium]
MKGLLWNALEWTFVVLDVLLITRMYDWLGHRLKSSSRRLTDWEYGLAQSVFGKSIDLHRVRIDERAYLGSKQYGICYVSFNTINSWGEMSDSLLVHELVHVWQYQHFGAVYIPRALWAQRTKEGYNYGGVKALSAAIAQGKPFWAFNYEQQGDIVADYYRILMGLPPYWGNGQFNDLPITFISCNNSSPLARN